MKNAGASWDAFEPLPYVAANYEVLLDLDRQILEQLVQFWQGEGRPGLRAMDIGTGPNLYPLIVAVASGAHVRAIEHGAANRRYLREQLEKPAAHWKKFWDLTVELAPEWSMPDWCARLNSSVSVEAGDLLKLAPGDADVATMFFVAESMTSSPAEFHQAVQSFLAQLRPGGSFFAAFMPGSKCYATAGRPFPAVPVTAVEVCAGITAAGGVLQGSTEIAATVRDGHDGAVMVWGRRRG